MEVVATIGFTGFKTAAAEKFPDAVAVMDPFRVGRLAGEAVDVCRRRIQILEHGHRAAPATRSIPADAPFTLEQR